MPGVWKEVKIGNISVPKKLIHDPKRTTSCRPQRDRDGMDRPNHHFCHCSVDRDTGLDDHPADVAGVVESSSIKI